MPWKLCGRCFFFFFFSVIFLCFLLLLSVSLLPCFPSRLFFFFSSSLSFLCPPVFLPFRFSYVLVSLLSFFFLFVLYLSISGSPFLSLCFFRLLYSKNSLSLFFGYPLFFSSPSPLFHPLKNIISSILPLFFWHSSGIYNCRRKGSHLVLSSHVAG